MNHVIQTILCCPKCGDKLSSEGSRTFCSICRKDVLVDNRFIDFNKLTPQLNLSLDTKVQEITEYAGAVMKDIKTDWRMVAVLEDIRKNAKGSVCLEIGGADGPMTPTLEHLFDTTLTLDYSKHFLKRIQRKTERAICIYANAHFLPIQDNVLDMIVCCEVLEHSTIPTQLLTELRRTIKKNGVIVLSVPNEQVPCHRKQLSEHEYFHAEDTHINFFTPYSLERLLFRTGLEIVSMKTIYPPIYSIKSFFLENIKNAAKRSFTGNFIVSILRPMDDPWLYWDMFSKNIKK